MLDLGASVQLTEGWNMEILSSTEYSWWGHSCHYFSSLLCCPLIWKYEVCIREELRCFIIHKNKWMEQVRIKSDWLSLVFPPALLSWSPAGGRDVGLLMCVDEFCYRDWSVQTGPSLGCSVICNDVSAVKQTLLAPERVTEKNTPFKIGWGSRSGLWPSSTQLLAN